MPLTLAYHVNPDLCLYAESIGPSVCVPISCIDGLTDAELGKAVRAAQPLAAYAQALEIAYWVTADVADIRDIPGEIVESHAAILQRHAGQDPKIDTALSLLQREAERRREAAAQRRYNTPTRAETLRRDIRAHYATLFMQIGRRDGFHCQQCGSTTGLEIDHIIALARGGGNDLLNLQLLCGLCNSTKGDRG
jgi:hypothetical protein